MQIETSVTLNLSLEEARVIHNAVREYYDNIKDFRDPTASDLIIAENMVSEFDKRLY